MTNLEMFREALNIYEDFKGIDSDAYYGNDETRNLLMIAVIAAQLVLLAKEK